MLLEELATLKISLAEKIVRCSQLEEENRFALEAARSFRSKVMQLGRQNEVLAKELQEMQLRCDDQASIHRVFLEVHRLCKGTRR